MENLALPNFDFNIKKADGKILIFDAIRKKNVVLTPEEWVRQNLVRYLIEYLEFPKALIKVESGLRYNNLQKRSDILVYSRAGEPLLLVECKAPTTAINEDSLLQVSTYNATLNARYVLVSNGLKHYLFKVSHGKKDVTPMAELPKYDELES